MNIVEKSILKSLKRKGYCLEKVYIGPYKDISKLKNEVLYLNEKAKMSVVDNEISKIFSKNNT